MNVMKDELFSVIIPTYNRRHVVCEAVSSVLKQSYQNIEVIVIDDGSEDGTERVFREEKNQQRVHYFLIDHGGVQRARNYGLSKAKGDLVLFLDSDDVLLPNCLEKMNMKYKADTELGAVYGLTGLRNLDGSYKLARNDYLEGRVYKEVLKQGYLTSTSFISMRKEVFEKIGQWDINLPSSQDDDMCFRLAKNYKISLINEIVGIYGVGAGNQIGGSEKRVALGWWMLWQKYENDVVSYCGKDILKYHFEECAERFKKCGLINEYNDVMGRIGQYA